MATALVWVLWPGSVVFVAMLSFRMGVRRSDFQSCCEPTALPRSRHGDDAESEPDTTPIRQVPANATRTRWWSNDDDTEVLPRLQDLRPPARPTPIRRPPWVG